MTRLHTIGLIAAGVAGAVCLSEPVAAQGYAPDEAARHMTVAKGFEVSLVASEPLVRQPVCIEFDDRGRLWVIQYLQYPNPEGLEPVEVDRFSRTRYNRVPEPPPHGPRGADRISILSDEDGDGCMDAARDFVDGLNLATGIAFGHGGVFVLNVPYLLFYPDADRNDVPDGDPEVLLRGFGMEDAHSVANSLTWGPDGWLYGCQGSTVTANVRGIEFQQGVWRYHPQTRRFELFCEGGGNSWGLDFDRLGNLFYSTNYGGYVLLHGVQGGYYVKSFAKHGELHNAHAYGFFDHAPHTGFTGGHVTVGGVVYQEDAFPSTFRGKYIAADLLGHAVYWHDIIPRGSTVETAHGGILLKANDDWFAPTDVTIGPDGAVYVADWHDARTAHPDPNAEWDRTNGRIYRIAPPETPHPQAMDYSTLSTGELLNHHIGTSQWHTRRARQEIIRRDDPEIVGRLRDLLRDGNDPAATLEAIWTLECLGVLDDTQLAQLLASPQPPIRYWALRSLGNDPGRSSKSIEHLVGFAERESNPWVRQQLACTAGRISAEGALPLIAAAIDRNIDSEDPLIPLLWWWALERHCSRDVDHVLALFEEPQAWSSELARRTILPRLARRLAAEGTREGSENVLRLLTSAPDLERRHELWDDVLLGLQQVGAGDRHAPQVTADLAELICTTWARRPDDPNLHKLAILLEHPQALEAAMSDALAPDLSPERRIRSLEALQLTSRPTVVDPLLKLVQTDAEDSIRIAALQVLVQHDHGAIAETLLELHQRLSSESLKSRVRDVLVSRKSTAETLVGAVERGELKPDEIPIDQIRRVSLFDDPQLRHLLTKHWGRLRAATPEEKLAEVRRLNNDLRAEPGDAIAGRKVFKLRCAECHRLFGEGKELGPDLTTANRSGTQALLVNLVDPSSVIRKEYVSLVVQTTDGRILTGLPVERGEAGITLVDSQGKSRTVPAGEVEGLSESNVSIMPDDLYRRLTPQQLRDLFAYLQLPEPPD